MSITCGLKPYPSSVQVHPRAYRYNSTHVRSSTTLPVCSTSQPECMAQRTIREVSTGQRVAG
eukprot:120795-Rhodomonas_salina.1